MKLKLTFPSSILHQPFEKKNGLSKAEDGNYYYYADDVVDTSFTGFADCDNERMYEKNGKVDTTYTSVTGWSRLGICRERSCKY